jgi:hypothetical protein
VLTGTHETHVEVLCHHIAFLTPSLCLQNLNVLTVGAKDGKGGFFPEGIAGRINTPEGFDALAEGIEDWDGKAEARQVCYHICSHCFS